MQFLQQLEDAYGFHGYKKLDPTRATMNRSALESTNSKNQLLNSESKIRQRPLNSLVHTLSNKKKKEPLFDLDLTGFDYQDKNKLAK